MNELANANDRRMKVGEVAEALGVTDEAIKKHVREMYPELMRNGVATHLNEEQVTAIKQKMIPTTQVVGAMTDLEAGIMAARVIGHYQARYEQEQGARIEAEGNVARLEAKIEADRPKLEFAERALLSEDVLSLDTAAKSLKLPYGVIKFAARLREMAILREYPKNIPYQQYVNQGYFVVDNVVKDCGGTDRIFPTTRVTPKGLAWLDRIKDRLEVTA